MPDVIPTWIVASATVANVGVYLGLWIETRRQIALARASFLESHAPILSVALTKCEFSESERGLKFRIVIRNRGPVAANQVDLIVTFGGSNERKEINNIAVPPKEKLTYGFVLPMGSAQYATGQIKGNYFNALIEGSYIGLAGQRHMYKARLDYDPALRRFVPILMNW